MAGKLERFSQQSGKVADYLAIAREDYARMERRADALKAERDELAAALIAVLNQHGCNSQAGDIARAALAKLDTGTAPSCGKAE